ncbi:hypothetical protein FQA39_LY12891 [Lamprigera yunnana]|nr:hypothetical protein FQA39_LY12891 [Lamprigera yunnana]
MRYRNMEKQKISKQENNDSFKNVETIIFHRYQDKDGIYRIDLQNINKVDINTKIISEEINPNEKYVKIYNKSLNEAIKHLRLEKPVTKECAKQVAAATAQYEIILEQANQKIYASDKEIIELKNKDQIKDAKLEASDREIQQLKEQNIIGESHDEECQKQIDAATAEYKIRLDASEKRNEVSDKEIQELKIYKQDSQIEIRELREQNIVLTNALTKAGLL